MRVLVVGSGGREHCLAWKLSESELVSKLYCAPGNGGTATFSENVNIAATDLDRLLEFAQKENIDLTVVGPEAPLVEGIVDRFEEKGLKIFGPCKDLALLEGSKVFAKEVMKKYGVPTADFKVFTKDFEAKEYIKNKKSPLVVKADGLAQGKGVIVCETEAQAIAAVDLIMLEKKFGAAGERIIVEELLRGEEVSVLIFTDGEVILPLVSSQDHKRIFDGDKGSNTGGMGAYSPAPVLSGEELDSVIVSVFKPLIEGLKKEGRPYKGILYGGLMICQGKPYVLEFNVRFGDPETQAILPKLKSDLAKIMLKVAQGNLGDIKLSWDGRVCLCVVLASGGYPGAYDKGKEIQGLNKVVGLSDIFVFHAGTKLDKTSDNKACKFLTAGGRVLNVTSLGQDIKEAQAKIYKAIENIYFDGMQYRHDIGNKALQRS